MNQFVGDRAIVLGGSVIGTLAARVLSETYREVIVVDRDKVLGVREVRRGAPHAAHAHAFHSRGFRIVHELFPALPAELERAEIPVPDLGEMRWYFNARLIRQTKTGLLSIGAQRPVIEDILRSLTASLPNVTYREQVEFVGYLTDATRERITGVRLLTAEDSVLELETDLVVDATGRGSRTPALLAALGYERPPEERMRIGLTYTTRLFHRREGMLDDTQSVNPVASPAHPRGAFFGRVGPKTCILSLTGIFGDRPPKDPEGFLAYAKSLPVSEVYEAVRDAEPMTDAVTFGFPASVRRHYERLVRFPDRLVVLGDAVCSFNPVYGQGMMVGAMQVIALRDRLSVGTPSDSLGLRQDIAAVVDDPWTISTNGDLDYPGVPGERTPDVLEGNKFIARLTDAATSDPALTEAFLKVAGLVEPPASLMNPDVVARVEKHVPA
ncbi:FAD-binding monooxygenase [Amycolatopsis sp. QT-25]|uniref:FAD-dependent oxidoreductase n=1 Tax=Amycolatopsis sp. QT-25 TaxID=3034022 RepID=UPI0023ECDBF1|nr:FAD-binding monooxygenase [Amycolatopsis sp. QT-25]WET83067.1 FAD-binding monooxygenase [Amycolatopsis sp. QT-25]